MNRGIPDRVPYDLSWGLAPLFLEKFREKTGRTDYEDYFRIDTRLIPLNPTRLRTDYLRYFEGRPGMEGLACGEWGIGHLKPKDSDLHFTHTISPLENATSVNDILDYPLPDLSADYRTFDLKRKVDDVHARGLAACAPVTSTLFEVAWGIRGIEPFLMDMVEDSDMAVCLLDRLTALRVEMVEKYVAAGVDVLMLGDDVSMQTGMLVNPREWRRLLKPRMALLIDAARRIDPKVPVFYHTDGDPTEIVEDLIEIGVTVLNPVQPECIDPARVKKLYGDRLAFWGAIGVQTNLPFGTPEDVRREVKLRMETIGKDGGFLIGPSHMIEPEVPWENLVAMFDAIEEFGAYR
jgi:uroporphyrinogen decarboxylase